MNSDTLKIAEDNAASAMIFFAKSNRQVPSDEEKGVVINALRVAGSSKYWRIEAQFILRDCITSTTPPQLQKIKVAIMRIVDLALRSADSLED